MSRLRLLQALVAVALIIGIGVGLSRVRWTSGDRPLVRWLPGEPEVSPVAEPEPALPETIPAKDPASEPMQCYVIKGPVRMAFEPEPEPKPEPEPAPIVWPGAGPQTLEAVARLIEDELRSSAGYEANDLIIGKLFDNVSHEQRGKLEAALEHLGLILPLAKPSTQAVNDARQDLLQADLEKWWLPSAEKTLAKGAADLLALVLEVKDGNVKLPGDPLTLKKALILINFSLDRQQQELTADDISWTEVDNRFYRARGVARASYAILDAIIAAYPEPIKSQSIAADLSETLRWLGQASEMNPLVVMGGDLDGFTSNHLVLMAYTLEKASDALDRAAARIE